MQNYRKWVLQRPRAAHDGYVMLTLFVDYILLTGPSVSLLQQIQDMLKKKISISELGPVSLILGMEVIRDEKAGTLKISQQKYVESVLRKYSMDTSNPVHTPGTPNQLVDDESEDTLLEPSEKTKYQAMVGSLIFLA